MKFQDMEFEHTYEFCALVENLTVRHTPQNTVYYACQLGDGETSADARIWDINLNKGLEEGKVYLFTAKANKYGDKLQLSISSIIEDNLPETELNKFFRSAPVEYDQIQKVIYEHVELIENNILKEITIKVLSDNKEKFFIYPAAVSMHHNYLRGLSYHTYSMLKMADKLIEIYPILNKNYLYSGIILHDMGKLKELSKEYNAQFTFEGNMLGHVVMSYNMVEEVAKELGYIDSEEVKILLHMILSHHGKLEYGSPKEPQTMEAWALHLCDLVDSKLASFTPEVEITLKEVEKEQVGKNTKGIASIEKKSLYVPYRR